MHVCNTTAALLDNQQATKYVCLPCKIILSHILPAVHNQAVGAGAHGPSGLEAQQTTGPGEQMRVSILTLATTAAEASSEAYTLRLPQRVGRLPIDIA